MLLAKDFAVDDEGKVRVPLYEELKAYLMLWTQYRHIKQIAQANGGDIYNVSTSGILSEFAGVELTKVHSRNRTAEDCIYR